MQEEEQERKTGGGKRSFGELILQVLFAVLQLTWGFPQTLAGFLVFLRYSASPHKRYQLACHTVWDRRRYGLSLGFFIFTDRDTDEQFIAHEYGHSIQSLLLGPFYLPLIGIPSLIWCLAKPFRRRREQTGKDYFSFYTEAWAERIADRYRG